MKYLLAGLGNAGPEYAGTRHNAGFEVLDRLAEKSGVEFTAARYALRAECKYKGRLLILIKPTTMMNLSGKAVSYWLNKEKLPTEKLLVVTDDIALPVGKLRLRASGGDGGHNGLAHIIQTLGTQEFPRLRFGIGNDFPQGRQVDYVLGPWESDVLQIVIQTAESAADVIKSFVSIGIDRTMTQINTK